jgi:hypothetical protein
MKVVIKATSKEVVKKRTSFIEIFSSSNSEISLPPFEENFYIVREVAPKNDQWFVHFTKAKQKVY